MNVVVTNTDSQTATLTSGYTYILDDRRVTSITPNSGTINGGIAVTITGANFLSGATVKFGGTSATGVTVVSSTIDHSHHSGPRSRRRQRRGNQPGYQERHLEQWLYLHRA